MKKILNTRFSCTLLFVIVAAFFSTLAAQGQSPKLSIQGVLRKSDGSAVPDGEFKLTFKLWDAAVGGTLAYTESPTDVLVTGGIYSYLLGSAQPLTAAFDKPYWLGVTVGSPLNNELSPRAQLSSAPYTLSILGQSNVFPSNGSVGIGTTAVNSDAKLQVEGNIRVQNDANIVGLDQVVGFNDLKLNGDATGGPDITIAPNGNVGIGTTAVPNNKLEVNGGLTVDGNLSVIGQVTGGLTVAGVTKAQGGAIVSGNLEVTNDLKFTQPSGKIYYYDRFLQFYSWNDVNNNPYGIGVMPSSDNTGALGSSAQKWSQVYCNDVWYLHYHDVSDKRVKENIVKISNPLEKIKKLNGMQYDINTKVHPMYKNATPEDIASSKNKMGFLAQELKEVFPDMVNFDKEMGVYNIVNKDQLIALLVEGIKEQQQIIDNQQTKIDKILKSLDKAGIKVED